MNISTARRNAMLDTLTASAANGYIRTYNGTKPANADAALSGNTLLAEMRLGATAFAAASGGVLTANAITSDASADATGTPTFSRILASDGTTVLLDLTAAVGSGEHNFTTSITAGQTIPVSSFSITIPA